MSTATFDTHAALGALTRAGVATEHAEAMPTPCASPRRSV